MTAPEESEWPRPSERFLAGMELAQTPRQQQIARQIYDRLAGGAEVDDVKDLIERMIRTVARERHPDQKVPDPDAPPPDDSRANRHVMRFDVNDDE
jgi:hypothetical protein